MAKSALTNWQMGIILVIITLGLLAALLAQHKGGGASAGSVHMEVTSEQMEVDIHGNKKVPRYQRNYEESLKWSFYTFFLLTMLYLYAFTVSAYKNSVGC